MSVARVTFVRNHRRRASNKEFNDFTEIEELQFHVPKLERTFDYSDLGKAIGVRKARLLAKVHVRYISSFARRTALGHYHTIVALAKSIVANREVSSILQQCRALNSKKGAKLWRAAVATYVKEMEKVPRKVTSFAEDHGNLFRTLDELASCGVAASCHRRPLPKNYHAAGGHRPTLVEQSGQGHVNDLLVDEITEKLLELKIDLESNEVKNLIRALASHVPVELLSDEVAFAEAVFNLNAKALSDIRRLAEQTFLEWRDVWTYGQALLVQSNPKVSTSFQFLLTLSKHKKSAAIDQLFHPNLGDEARSNFIRFLHDSYGPIVGAALYTEWPTRMYRHFVRLGGKNLFDAYFSLHRRGVVAAVLLYLTDSGANVSTALTLTAQSERLTDDQNFVQLVTYKDRAGPEPIIKHLPINDPAVKVTAVQALRGVIRMTQSRREMFPHVGDALFISTYFLTPSVVDIELVANNLRYMLRDSSNSNTRWTPSAIRVSVALDVSGRKSGQLSEVARQMDHAIDSSSTPIYGLKFAVRLVLRRRIREYATLLEASMSTHASRGSATLLYPGDLARQILKKAHKTGLGFLCKDPTVMGGKADAVETSCPQLGNCPGCSSQIYVVTVENLAETIALHDALSTQAEQMEEGQSTIWKRDWLLLYAHCIALLKLVKRSKFAYLVPKAEKLAKQICTEGYNPMLIKA